MLKILFISAALTLFFPLYSALSLQLSHSCEGESWETRGVISVKSERSTSGNFSQRSISSRLLSCLWAQAQSDGFYYLRAPSSFSPDKDTQPDSSQSTQYVQSFTKSRQLFCSDLADHVTIYTDSKGSILSIFSESKRSCLSWEEWSRGSRSPGKDRFSSGLSLLHAHQHPGPEPPVQEFLDLERRKEAGKEKGEEKSFIQKYWQYLLVGFIVYTLMTVFARPGEQGAGE